MARCGCRRVPHTKSDSKSTSQSRATAPLISGCAHRPCHRRPLHGAPLTELWILSDPQQPRAGAHHGMRCYRNLSLDRLARFAPRLIRRHVQRARPGVCAVCAQAHIRLKLGVANKTKRWRCLSTIGSARVRRSSNDNSAFTCSSLVTAAHRRCWGGPHGVDVAVV